MGLYEALDSLLRLTFNRKKKFEVRYPLSDEQIRNSDLFKAIVARLRTVEGQHARELADKSKIEQSKKEKDWQEEIKEKLLSKEKELRKKRYKKSFSLTKALVKLSNDKRVKGKIEVVDREDKTVFGIFQDILFLPDGKMAITIKGNKVVSVGRTLNELIFKPDSLHNYLRRRKIMIPIDEEGNYVPDIENMEMYDIASTDDGRYRQASEKMYKVKELLIRKDLEEKNLRALIERNEATIVELQAKIRDLSKANRVLQHDSDISETHFEAATRKLMNIQSNLGTIMLDNAHLREHVAYMEKVAEKIESQREKLLEKTQDLGIKSDFEKMSEMIFEFLERSRELTPETIIQQTEKEVPKQVLPIQPGQALKK